MKDILITGGSGMIGKNLILSLNKDYHITATFNKSKGFKKWLRENKLRNVKAIKIDLSNAKKVKDKFKLRDYDFVIHLASVTNTQDSGVKHNKKNILDVTKNLVKNVTCKCFIYFSTTGVYGSLKRDITEDTNPNPTIPYSKFKLQAEKEVEKAYKKGMCGYYFIIRFNGGFGPYEHPRKITSKFITNVFLNKELEYEVYGDGVNYIDLLYESDITSAIRMMLIKYNEAPSGIYNLAMENPMTITDLIGRMSVLFKIKDLRVKFRGETQEPTMIFPSCDKFKKAFDYKPRSNLDQGLVLLAVHLRGDK